MIRSELFSYQFFQVCKQSAWIFVTIFMVKMGLSPSEVGKFEWIFYVGGLISFLWLNPSIQLILYQKEATLEDCIHFVYRLVFIISLCVYPLTLFAAWMYVDVVGLGSLSTLAFYLLFLFGSNLLLLHTAVVYRKKKIIQVYLLGLLYFMVVVTSFWTIRFEQEMRSVFFYLAMGGLAFVFLFYPFGILFTSSQYVYRLYWSRFVQLVLYTLIGFLPLYVDGLLVKYFYTDPEYFAIYRLGARELPLVIPLLISLSQSMVPLLEENLNVGLEKIKVHSRPYVIACGLVLVLLLCFSNDLFHTLYSDEYESSVLLFDISLFLVVSKFIFSNSIFYSLGKFKFLNAIGLAEMILNLILSVVFIQIWGLPGIVLATVFAYFFEKIIHLIYLRNCLGISAHQFVEVYITFVISVAMIVIMVVKYF